MFYLSSLVHGYCEHEYIYGHLVLMKCWSLRKEWNNHHDNHAVAVIMDGITVGHVPRDICKRVFYFLDHHGSTKITEELCNSGAEVGPGLEFVVCLSVMAFECMS